MIFSAGLDNASQGRGDMSFMVIVYLLEARFLIVIKITLKSVLIAIEQITLLIDVGSYMANLLGLFELLICLILLDHLLHMILIFLVLPLTTL